MGFRKHVSQTAERRRTEFIPLDRLLVRYQKRNEFRSMPFVGKFS